METTIISRLLSKLKNEYSEKQSLGSFIFNELQFESILQLLPGKDDENCPAIYSTTLSVLYTHKDIKHFITNQFNLGEFNIQCNDRVGVILPNGKELGLCLVATCSYCTCVPMNSSSTIDEIKHDIEILKVKALIVDTDLVNIEQLKSMIMILKINKTADTLKLELVSDAGVAIHSSSKSVLNGPQDISLLLQTSGTTGQKKTVPYTLKTLMVGALCVAYSWRLTPTDCNLNMMPLFHVGGIVRNLLAPLLTGGSVILCSAFDPNLFWDILQTPKCPVSWYYAVPTMHSAILQIKELREASGSNTNSHLRMICNAGGGLLPSMAEQLQKAFTTVILPCYGMTECMPISCPSVDYKLNRRGTSGTACGPEIQIFDDNKQLLTQSNQTGRICVRGPPLFDGYENVPNSLTFTEDGWFDTGDMGYLDDDQFLYITGRSKEVINRGGEIISPSEIEEAIIQNSRVRQAMVFSVPHDVLQETIGLVLVPRDPVSRIGLVELQKFLGNLLHPSKWPQLIVYMNDLPKNRMNKPIRIGLAERLQLKELKDSDPIHSRLYEATAPPTTAPNKSLIPCQNVSLDTEQVYTTFNSHPLIVDFELVASTAYVVTSELLAKEAIWEYLESHLHDYLRPKDIIIVEEIPRDNNNNVNLQLLASNNPTAVKQQSNNALEVALIKIFCDVLDIDDDMKSSLNSETDFFQVGGNSLKAGLLFNRIRKEMGVSLAIMKIYVHRTIGSLRELIEEQDAHIAKKLEVQQQAQNKDRREVYQLNVDVKSKSQTRFSALFVQSLGLLLLKPVCIALHWYLFVFFLILMRRYWTRPDQWLQVVSVIVAIVLARLALNLFILPGTSLMVKWIVIGRYRRGHYPLWGHYYLRWWFVDQTIKIFGFGVFGSNDKLRIFFLRLMGAKIGKNVTIDPNTEIREFDLIKIKSNVKIQRCVLSAFTLSTGYMVLAPIQIGNNCSIGTNARLSPGATVSDGVQVGPLSSSYEMNSTANTEQSSTISKPKTVNFIFKLLFGWPVILAVSILSYIPWIGAIYLLVDQTDSPIELNEFISVIYFFADGKRVGFHLVAAVARDIMHPFIYVAGCIIVKRIFIGKFHEQNNKFKTKIAREFHLLKHWLMKELLPGRDLHGITHLIGTHYELVSIIYRLLGARIGKRVYWPGSGLNTYEYDLLTIEDDVVFGSRSYFLCSNGDKTCSKRITIKSGSMIADRCVLLPGVTVERNTVMGSGSLGKEGTTYPANSVWIGSKDGNAILWSQDEEQKSTDTITPFGRAFYKREKTGYWVIPLWLHVIYNMTINIFRSIFWSAPIVISIQLMAIVFRRLPESSTSSTIKSGVYTYFLLVGFLSVFYTSIALLALFIDIRVKWLLFGRRQPGQYNWDQSSYCQRWQLHIVIQHFRQNILDRLCGSAYLCFYYRRLGCHIGRNVCLYPNGGDPMMTESDLVTIGDDSCIDDASVICHLNSKGRFTLNPLVIGKRCVLRSQSRLLSGASMEDDSTLLEHTLIISGDTTDEGTIWQGWPAADVTKKFRGKRVSMQIEHRRSIRHSKAAKKSSKDTIIALLENEIQQTRF